MIRVLLLISLSCLLVNCARDKPKKKLRDSKSDQVTIQKTLGSDLRFTQIINELSEIHFFLHGKDSVLESHDPCELMVLNSIKLAFDSPFDSTQTGLEQYKDVALIQKYDLKEQLEGKQTNRSATIILMQFQNSKKANAWYDVFDQSLYKEFILNKPRTTLWQDKNKIYFIQTYFTPNRDCIDILKQTIQLKLSEHGNK